MNERHLTEKVVDFSIVSMPNIGVVSKAQLTLCTIEIVLVCLWVHRGIPYMYLPTREVTSDRQIGREDVGKK